MSDLEKDEEDEWDEEGDEGGGVDGDLKESVVLAAELEERSILWAHDVLAILFKSDTST